MSSIMDGAALLGPLPAPWRRIRKRSQPGHWFDAFINHDTGAVQSVDPRLQEVPFPAGWERRRHDEEDEWDWYVNRDNQGGKEGYARNMDPRVRADDLRGRGVPLETFYLV